MERNEAYEYFFSSLLGEGMALRFEYLEPRTVHEAISLLSRYGCAAKLIAGGTDLLNEIRSKQIAPEYIIDIGAIPGIDSLTYDDHGTLSIGALATLRAVETSPQVKRHHTVISQAAGQIGSVAIRNVGTIAGNLCHASPAADMAPSLLALGAKAKIVGLAGERTVALDDFFAGPGRTVLAHDELLVAIDVPAMPPQAKVVYLKHAIRGSADLSIVGVAVMASLEDGCCRNVKIALGAVAPTPMRARSTESVLEGKKLDDALIENAGRAASDECRPITDVRASADYRREMVGVAAIGSVADGYIHNVRIALGAVASTPMRARSTESVLEGKKLDDALIENAARAASEECRPITDVRASADYRREMVKVLTRWAIKRVFAENKQASNEATAKEITMS